MKCAAAGAGNKKTLRQLLCAMRKNPTQWPPAQYDAMNWLQRAGLKSARALRMKQSLRLLYREMAASNCEEVARGALMKWIS